MDADILKLALENGATLALAVFAICMLNRTWKDWVAEAQRYAEDVRSLVDMVRQSLERNSEALSKLLARLTRDDG